MEKKESLKDWLDKLVNQRMNEAGFTVQTTPIQKTPPEATPINGSITFLKDTLTKKVEQHYQQLKDKK